MSEEIFPTQPGHLGGPHITLRDDPRMLKAMGQLEETRRPLIQNLTIELKDISSATPAATKNTSNPLNI